MSKDLVNLNPIRNCLGTYRGHEGTVYCIDVFSSQSSPSRASLPLTNGKVSPMNMENITIVTGSHDQTILIWHITLDPLHVTQHHRLKAHTDAIYALQVSHEDLRHQLLSCGDYTLRLWNMDTGTHTPLTGHTGFVSCLRVRGRRVWTGSWDGTLRSWNLATTKPMHLFQGHKSVVNCVDVNETDVFSGSWDMNIIQWSRATGEMVHIYKGHTDGVQCVQWYNDELYSGSMDKTVRVWSTKNAKTTKIFRGHQGGVECLQVTRGICFTGSYDKTIRAFDIKTGDCLAIFEGHTDGVYCLKIYGDKLFSGSGDKSIRIWDVKVFTMITKGSSNKKEKALASKDIFMLYLNIVVI